MGGPTQLSFGYDDLYRLTGANGRFTSTNSQETYTLAMNYDNIHNIVAKNQLDQAITNNTPKTQAKTSYNWTYAYQGAHPHAPTHIGNRTYTYDADGNQTGWTDTTNGTRRIINWDEDNRITDIMDGGQTNLYKYDDQGNRTIKRGKAEIAYLNQYYIVRNGNIPTKHIYAGTSRLVSKQMTGGNVTNGGPAPGPAPAAPPTTWTNVQNNVGFTGIANRNARANAVAQNTLRNPNLNGGIPGGGGAAAPAPAPGPAPAPAPGGGGKVQSETTYYYHPDHLGSTGFVTDQTGKLYEHLEYFPFGETWLQEGANTNKTPYLFTSKEFDEETGLYYFGARYYDPRTSVWQSADPILGKYLPTGNKEKDAQLPGIGGIYNPFNLGMYTYGHQNPVFLKDPDGNATQEERTRSIGIGLAGIRNENVYQSIVSHLPKGLLPASTYTQKNRGSMFTDCSGFTTLMTGVSGNGKENRGSWNMYENTEHVPTISMIPGDLAFFKSEEGDHLVDHVGVIKSVKRDDQGNVLNFTMIHTTPWKDTGKSLQTVDLTAESGTRKGHWKDIFVGVGTYRPETDPVRPNVQKD